MHVVLKPPAAGMGSFHVCSNDFTSYWHPCYWYMILRVIGRSGFVTFVVDMVVSQITCDNTCITQLHNKTKVHIGIYYFLLG